MKRVDVVLSPASRARLAAITALLALLAACAGPSPSENFFALNDGGVVISPPAPALHAAPSAAAQRSSLPGIVVSAVTIPELIDRPQIVTRDSANRVIVSEQNLWAESIKSGVARTLAARLERAMKDAGQMVQVGAYPQTSITDPALRITVDIVRFDAVPNGEAVVEALWSIRRPADDLVRTGHTTASAPISGVGYDAIVHAWNVAVSVVDLDIAAAVREVGMMPAKQPVPVVASPAPTDLPKPPVQRRPRAKPPASDSQPH
jgi:uncharacterized lipoprotein YmbA